MPIGLGSRRTTRATRYSTSGVMLSGSRSRNSAWLCCWANTRPHMTESLSSAPDGAEDVSPAEEPPA
eukprot:534527-Prymnesium_polylepis.1